MAGMNTTGVNTEDPAAAQPGAPEIVVHPESTGSVVLAAAVAARLITRLADLQAAGKLPRLVLTGGGVGIATLEQVRQSPAREAVDWSQVEFYWGDERYLPPGDPERNEVQARAALLDHVPVTPAHVHPMGADKGEPAEVAAAEYAEVIGEGAFDITLLGIGPEGHTASVFPHSPAVRVGEPTVVAVHDSPKPPPTRISLTLAAIRRSAEVWIIAGGAAKAEPLAEAFNGASEADIPLAGARGRERTLWLIDRPASPL